MTDIKTFGAVGDGLHDDYEAFQTALNIGGEITVPEGTYVLSGTLKVKSDTHIIAHPNAVIKIGDGAQSGRYDHLLTNADHVNGNKNIIISGGIWHGNCINNDRGNNLFDKNVTTGALLSFINVKNLTLENMKLMDPLCYYMRFCIAEGVKIHNIRFESEHCALNQDGIHFSGFCRNFDIQNLFGTAGSPSDDFLAFNADDALFRQESFDLYNGPIENITVENIHSDKCHCFVRFLSVTSPIKNIHVKNITGKCIGTALNMDAARYCRVPLFHDTDAYALNGVGEMENILLENMDIVSEDKNNNFFMIETNVKNFTVKNVRITQGEEALHIRKMCEHHVDIDGRHYDIKYGDEIALKFNKIDELKINRTR